MDFRVYYTVKLGRDDYSELHAHDHWEIVLVSGSGGYTETMGKRHDYESGDLLLHSPRTQHVCYSRQAGAHHCLGLAGIELSALEDGVMRAPEPVQALFAGIADELEGRRAYYREIIQSKATEVGWQLLRACGGLAVDLPKAGNGAGALKVLLDREWRSRKDLGEIGGQLLMSREYLRHLFKKEYGVSPVQYLIMKRMDHARSLLRSTDQSVKSIAYECGFGDEHYFSRLFRKAVGVSPSEFRRRRLG